MGASAPAGGGHLARRCPQPDPMRTRILPSVRGGPGALVFPGGWVTTTPLPAPRSRPPLSAPGEGEARCHFTCAQRVVRRSLGAGRGSRQQERDSRTSRGSAWAASPVGPAVPTGTQHSTAALRAPPPPAAPPPPRLSATSSLSSLPTSAISKVPSPGRPRPAPAPIPPESSASSLPILAISKAPSLRRSAPLPPEARPVLGRGAKPQGACKHCQLRRWAAS